MLDWADGPADRLLAHRLPGRERRRRARRHPRLSGAWICRRAPSWCTSRASPTPGASCPPHAPPPASSRSSCSRRAASSAYRRRRRGSRAACGCNRDRVYDAAFVRAGIVRVDTIEELFAAAASLGANAARRGSGLRNGRLALLTNGHAPGGAGRRHGRRRRRRARPPDARLYGEITRAVGPTASLASSVDLGPDAGGDAYAAALDVLLDTPTSTACWSSTRPRPGSTPARWPGGGGRRRPAQAAQRAAAGARRLARRDQPSSARASRSRPRRSPSSRRPRPPCAPSCTGSSYERRQFHLRQTPASRADEPSRPARRGRRRSSRRPWRRASARSPRPRSMALLEAYGIPAVATRLAADLRAGRRAPHARSATRWR